MPAGKGTTRKSMVKALLFDLDDTLCDDAAAWIACAHKAAALGIKRYWLAVEADVLADLFLKVSERYWAGVDYMTDKRPLSELRASQFAQAVADAGLPPNPAAEEAMAAEYSRIRSREIDLYPDALPTLEALRRRGIQLALITNGLVSTHVEKIEQLGLQSAVDHVVIADAVGLWKPDRKIFDHTLALCGVGSAEAAMVGDSMTSDVGGAQNAGIPAVWFNPNGRVPKPGDPEPMLGEIASLGDLLKRRDLVGP